MRTLMMPACEWSGGAASIGNIFFPPVTPKESYVSLGCFSLVFHLIMYCLFIQYIVDGSLDLRNVFALHSAGCQIEIRRV